MPRDRDALRHRPFCGPRLWATVFVLAEIGCSVGFPGETFKKTFFSCGINSRSSHLAHLFLFYAPKCHSVQLRNSSRKLREPTSLPRHRVGGARHGFLDLTQSLLEQQQRQVLLRCLKMRSAPRDPLPWSFSIWEALRRSMRLETF